MHDVNYIGIPLTHCRCPRYSKHDKHDNCAPGHTKEIGVDAKRCGSSCMFRPFDAGGVAPLFLCISFVFATAKLNQWMRKTNTMRKYITTKVPFVFESRWHVPEDVTNGIREVAIGHGSSKKQAENDCAGVSRLHMYFSFCFLPTFGRFSVMRIVHVTATLAPSPCHPSFRGSNSHSAGLQ